MSKFDGKEGSFISLSESKRLISNFRNANPDHAHSIFFGCDLFNDLLAESGCVGIRIYYAQDDSGEPKMVLVGVDKHGENIIKRSNTESLTFTDPSEITPTSSFNEDDPGDSGMADGGKVCPPDCPNDDLP